jgi:hypothetical protein
MILVYFINLLIIKILGCSDSKGSSGGGETNDNNKLDINEVYYNGIKIYVRKANKNSISGMIKRIKNKNLIKGKNVSSTPITGPNSIPISTPILTPTSVTNLTLITKKEPTEEQIINRMKVKYKLLLKERNKHLNKLKSEGKKPNWANNLASLENNFNDEYTENYIGSKELMIKLRKEAINELKSEEQKTN